MFPSAWRCYPNLIFTKKTLSLKQNACGEDHIARAFTCIVDQILKNHSGNGLKTLKLNIFHCHNLDAHYLNNWLQIAITPRAENLILKLPLQYEEGYSFPCSLLFGGNRNSIQHLHLACCAFRPTFGVGCFRSLTKFYLFGVRITGEELGCLLRSLQCFCFGTVWTQRLQWNNLPEDTMCAAATQPRDCVYMGNAANDREQSSQPLHL
jgi:hypothetical protein